MALTSSDILHDLRQGDKSVLASVYSAYRTEFIQWITSKYSCDPEEAKDIYQQVILTFYENVVSEKLVTLTSSVKTYLFSIGKNKYKAWARNQNRHEGFSKPLKDVITDGEITFENQLNLVEDQLVKLGEPCKSLLIQFYYHHQSIDELALKFGYKNPETTKNQKYKCLERLRKMVLGSKTIIPSENI